MPKRLAVLDLIMCQSLKQTRSEVLGELHLLSTKDVSLITMLIRLLRRDMSRSIIICEYSFRVR
uniref:Uncharacterized protein n=1 Tax=Triticum urartu TaxID=4572 RepID=A0A8R7UUC8_TRIUA